jgi:hypothetical protein
VLRVVAVLVFEILRGVALDWLAKLYRAVLSIALAL